MPSTCSIPVRYNAGASQDARLVDSARGLAALLSGSAEYQEYLRLGQAVNGDEQVAELLAQIRTRHASYREAGGGELAARLEGLPVMAAYRRAEQALRELCAEVDGAVGAAAGLAFSAHIRPQGHG